MTPDYNVGKGKVEIRNGSITRYSADALVCPANPDLEMVAFPGGVQFAFLSEGGPEIFKEASDLGEKLRRESTGRFAAPEASAHATTAGNLDAKYVFHSVSVGRNPETDSIYCDGEIIGNSTRSALQLARDKELKSIGFPALGTGLYSVSIEEAVEAMIGEFSRHLRSAEATTIERIGLVLYGQDSFEVGERVAKQLLKPN